MSISQILKDRGYVAMPPRPPEETSQVPSYPALSQRPPAPPPLLAPAPVTASASAPVAAMPRQQLPQKQIHRNRAQHICYSCRRRKVKCDRQHPVCGGCAKMGVPCEWSDNSQMKDDRKQFSANSTQQSPPNGASTSSSQQGQNIYTNGGTMPPPAFNPSQMPLQKRGHKRQRTHPDATISEESDSFSDDQRFDVARHAFGRDSLPYYPGGLGRSNSTGYHQGGTHTVEDQLETRLGRLAEIVDKWCRETYMGTGAQPNGSFNHESLLKDLKDLQAITKRRGSTSQEPTTATSSVPPPWENSQSEYSSYQQDSQQLPGGLRSPSTSAMDTSESVTHADDLPMSPFPDPPVLAEHTDNTLGIPGAEKIPNNWQTFRSKGFEEISAMFDSKSAEKATEEQNLDDVIDPRIKETPVTPKARRGGKKGQQKFASQAAGKNAQNEDEDELSLGHLSIQEDGRTRYVGSTFWAFISNEITELNQVLQSQNDNTAETKTADAATHELPKTCNLMEDEGQCRSKMKDQPMVEATQQTAFTPPDSLNISNKASPGSENHIPGGHDLTQIMAALDDEREHDHAAPINPSRDMNIFNILPENSTMCAAAKFQAGFAPEHQSRQMVWFLKYLPLEHQSHALYKAFLNGVHPVIPLLHSPSFNKDYTKFWKLKAHESTDGISFSPTFIPLLFAVLYTGALSISNKEFSRVFPDKEHTRNDITSHLHRAAMATLAVTAFPRGPTLSSLIAYLLIHTCKIREEEPLTSYAFVGIAMRAAQSAGLHREPSTFKGLNEVEREVRRRIWWHILYLDVQSAIATGLPPLGGSDESVFDTQMVSELKDEYIGTKTTPEDIQKEEAATKSNCTGLPESLLSMRLSTAMIAAVGRYEATKVLRKLVSSLFSVKLPQKQDVTAMGKIIFDLQTKIDERINRIPARGVPEMGFVPPGGPDEENSTPAEKLENFNGWARTMLSLMYDKCFSVLYQPFLRTILSKQWQHARQWKFIFLSTSPAFRPYFWFLPGTYQPLHSCMILLLDLYNTPKSDEAYPSRKLLDDVFELFGPDGNGNPNLTNTGAYDALAQRPLVEGGKEAWAMMARLRAKAYARAGSAACPASATSDPTLAASSSSSADAAATKLASMRDISQRYSMDHQRLGLTAKDLDEIIERSVRKQGSKTAVDPNRMITALTPEIGTNAALAAPSLPTSGLPATSEPSAAAPTGQQQPPPTNNLLQQQESRTPNLDYSVVDDLPIFAEMNGAQGYSLPDQQVQAYPEQEFHGGLSFSPNDFMAYDNSYAIGGVSLDAAGYPVIMAPGVMYNMETGRAQVQYEDHGGNIDSSSNESTAANAHNDMFMDMSRDNIDWNVWDRTFGTYASISQGADSMLTQALHAGDGMHLPEDTFS
ncbi:hypothetical protein Dda_2087 [Drechslerella dactyloides]|uniref:Zn(2)-C6 fungal-type domain-containing protein n=1 Tax=Drechslerella dactyloides TaxID=74499 RepID=A0AAD6J318_DREDA|nr:hypothetical protein Dda_2087 [Drechslerella dactyloides]